MDCQEERDRRFLVVAGRGSDKLQVLKMKRDDLQCELRLIEEEIRRYEEFNAPEDPEAIAELKHKERRRREKEELKRRSRQVFKGKGKGH